MIGTHKDVEVDQMLAALPIIRDDPYSRVKAQKANARVFWNPELGMLEIFPVAGGWLGVEHMNLQGDIAPFSD